MVVRSDGDLEPDAAAEAARLALERLLADPAAAPVARLLPAGYADEVERFVALLLAANRRLNLTRLVSPDAVARLHLLDALAALPHLGDASRIADLGSGGGVPGLPLALALPGRRWTLVEATAKKASILADFAAALGLDDVAVAGQRAELLGRDAEHRERYDAVVARACATLPVLAEYALPLLRGGGRLLAWKGPLADDDPELVAGRRAVAQLGGAAPRVVPSGFPALGGHSLVIVDKIGPTPRAYPRRPGEPARRPLGV